jgi:hypothetical protein
MLLQKLKEYKVKQVNLNLHLRTSRTTQERPSDKLRLFQNLRIPALPFGLNFEQWLTENESHQKLLFDKKKKIFLLKIPVGRQ